MASIKPRGRRPGSRRLRTKPITRFAVSLGVWCTPSKALPESRFLPFKCCSLLASALACLDLVLALSALALRARLYMASIEPLPVSLIVAGAHWASASIMALRPHSISTSRALALKAAWKSVAAGAYDVTSPAFLGLLSSGAARGSVDEVRHCIDAQHPEDFRGIF